MTTTLARPTELLTPEMLARFDERAPAYDRDNRFFYEDLEELKASGYLDAAIPPEFGGPGLKLADVVARERAERGGGQGRCVGHGGTSFLPAAGQGGSESAGGLGEGGPPLDSGSTMHSIRSGAVRTTAALARSARSG